MSGLFIKVPELGLIVEDYTNKYSGFDSGGSQKLKTGDVLQAHACYRKEVIFL